MSDLTPKNSFDFQEEDFQKDRNSSSILQNKLKQETPNPILIKNRMDLKNYIGNLTTKQKMDFYFKERLQSNHRNYQIRQKMTWQRILILSLFVGIMTAGPGAAALPQLRYVVAPIVCPDGNFTSRQSASSYKPGTTSYSADFTCVTKIVSENVNFTSLIFASIFYATIYFIIFSVYNFLKNKLINTNSI